MSEDDRRRLSALEHDLWSRVTRSIMPLARRRRPMPLVAVAKEQPHRVPPNPHRAPLPAHPVRPAPPALAPLERRLRQRLARGTEAIDARLDLHGRTQDEAHAVLLRFLQRAQRDGARLVLVITGKGTDKGTREHGVLRRQVPMWLALPELRRYVIGFETAHVGHGGEGALYVRVRRT